MKVSDKLPAVVQQVHQIHQALNRDAFLSDFDSALFRVFRKEGLLQVMASFLEKIGVSCPVFIGLVSPDGNQIYSYVFQSADHSESYQQGDAFSLIDVHQLLESCFLSRSFISRNIRELFCAAHAERLSRIAGGEVKKLIFFPVRDSAGHPLGIFTLAAGTGYCIPSSGENLVNRMVTSLGIALEVILLKEESIKRIKDKETLLRLSSDIADNTDKMALFPLLRRVFKKQGLYTDLAVSLINNDGMTTSGYLIDWKKKRHQHKDYSAMSVAKHNLHDGIFNLVLGSKKPVFFDLDEVVSRPEFPLYIKFLFERGIRHMVAVTLHNRGLEIGFLLLFSTKKKVFTQAQTELLYGMSQQIGTAVAHIRDEELKGREEFEKSFLLSMSYDVARIRKRADLLSVLNNRFRQLFQFSHCSIVLTDQELGTVEPFLVDPNSQTAMEADYQSLFTEIHASQDNMLSIAMSASKVMIFNLEQRKANNQLPKLLLKNLSYGVIEMMTIPLQNECGNFGVLCLFSKTPETFSSQFEILLNGVASQVSLAVSSILNNEELIEREKEKKFLLDFGNRLTGCHNREAFAALMMEVFSALLKLNHIGVSLYSHCRNFQYGYLRASSISPPEKWELLQSREYPITDVIFAQLERAEGSTVTFKVRDAAAHQAIPSYIPRDSDYALAIPLTGNNSTIGALLLYANEEICPGSALMKLIGGIGAQISLALTNVISYEKIEGQLAEISRYRSKLEKENKVLSEQIKIVNAQQEMVGESDLLKNVQYLISRVAPSDSAVLISGETGTGKELVARSIHNQSQRSKRIMIKINCAALPASLIESELFGHEKGSFTGANERRIGKFELADGGTIFLDEIGELSLELQVKMLRVLQENEIERIGGKETIKINVRIISATNRNLQKEVDEGRFRSDLFYRLNVFPIHLPPLRARSADIPGLVSHFITKLSGKLGKRISGISEDALDGLIKYNWPGNIRELEHAIERSILLSSGGTITEVFLGGEKSAALTHPADQVRSRSFAANERDYIIYILKVCAGKINGTGGAAEILGLPATTLHSKIKKLKIFKNLYR